MTEEPHLDIARQVAGRFDSSLAPVAIALGGSQRSGVADERSDVDIYVFDKALPPLAVRRAIASAFDSSPEIGNTAFGPGDEWRDRDTGIIVDVVYWTTTWIEQELARVLVNYEASTGYSTSFWHTVQALLPLSDRSGWLSRLKHSTNIPYPEELRSRIVELNFRLLGSAQSSYTNQIILAIARHDAVSVQHRIAAYLASLFDIIFALNRLPHPGEKRLVTHVLNRCEFVPDDFQVLVSDVIGRTAPPWDDGALLASLQQLTSSTERLVFATK